MELTINNINTGLTGNMWTKAGKERFYFDLTTLDEMYETYQAETDDDVYRICGSNNARRQSTVYIDYNNGGRVVSTYKGREDARTAEAVERMLAWIENNNKTDEETEVETLIEEANNNETSVERLDEIITIADKRCAEYEKEYDKYNWRRNHDDDTSDFNVFDMMKRWDKWSQLHSLAYIYKFEK